MGVDDETVLERTDGASDKPRGEGDVASNHCLRVSHRVVDTRLDKYLRDRFPRISRTVIQRYIRAGLVTVNGEASKPSYEPRKGDLIEIALPPPMPNSLIPEDLPLDVIYEDECLLAINKQAGIVCHPAHGFQTGTIANAIAFHAEKLSRGSDPFRPGIVHRLDKNTTGVMLIAKTDEAHWRISLQFERRTIKKQYFAICAGEISLDGDIIDKPLAPHPKTTEWMVLPTQLPPRQAMFKEAVTEYRVNTRYRGFTTVDLFPKTGRTHQLRVHMSSIGHPILGDTMYGGPAVTEEQLAEGRTGNESAVAGEPLIDSQALHARRIRFTHPIREVPIEIEAPLPLRITRILDLLERYRRR